MEATGASTASLTIRAARVDDLVAAAAVLNQHASESGDDGITEAELEGWWTAPDFELGWQVLVAELAGRLVGYVDVGDPNGDRSQLWLDLRVPRKGRALEADVRLLDGILDLARPRATAGTLFRPAYDAFRETFADAWGGALEGPYAEFLHDWGVGKDFEPSLWFLAEDSGELAGIALCLPERGGDLDLGWVSVLGVRRPWRRRGLGRALLLHAFHELRRRGRSRVGLGVDAESPTGAVALYESVGTAVVQRRVTLQRTL